MIRINTLVALIILFFISCEKNNVEENKSVLKLYGDVLEDVGYSVAKTENGYFIGGQFTEVKRSGELNNYVEIESSIKKMAIIKTDLNGNTLWKKSFGNSLASGGSKIIAMDDGSAICLGYTVDTITKQKDIFLVKISSDGQTSVQKRFNSKGASSAGDITDGNQYGIDLIQDGDNFVLLGSTDVGRLQNSTGNAEGNTDIFVLRLDSNLELAEIPESIGFPGNDRAAVIKSDNAGGYIIAATTDRIQPGNALNNILIVKTNSSGSVTQSTIIGTDDDEYASDIEVLDDGYFIAGTVGSSNTDQSVYVSKLPSDINGEQEFERIFKLENTITTATSFAINAICPYRTNSFVFAGQAGSGSSAKMLVFLVDANGNYVEGRQMVISATGVQSAYDILTDGDNIITVGKDSFENNSMISFYKFRF